MLRRKFYMEKAEEEARQQALLKKRSKVLQRDLPRPPAASLELIRNSLLSANGDQSSVVPPIPEEVADAMVRKELLQLLEHDNAKYPLDEKAEKKKGVKNRANSSISQVLIEDFEGNELQEADKMIKEEGQILRVSMKHENKSLDDFIVAHDECVKDLMYFPTRNAYGPSSVAVKAEKVAALQVEIENTRRKIEDDEKKVEHMKAKYKTYTKGHERRAEAVWSQIETSLKQIEGCGTEVECFKALKRQEEMAASFRKKNLEEEVVKQKETERKLQARYGNLLSTVEQAEEVMVGFQAQALKLAIGEVEDVGIAMEASA